MHLTLSYSEFQRVWHEYLNCLLRCSCITSPDLGSPTQVRRAEHLQIAELFNVEMAEFFSTFSSIDSGNNSLADKSYGSIYSLHKFHQNIKYISEN